MAPKPKADDRNMTPNSSDKGSEGPKTPKPIDAVVEAVEEIKGGGGGRSITAPDDTQIRRIMDSTSMNMVGRTLSDDEFDKYYKQYKNEYLSADGNVDTQQLLTERVRKEEDYQEMSVAKKFGAAMSNVLRGSL